MQESLGISISDKVIKYAKITKNNDQLDVASFGIKFYDNIERDIGQIILETNSSNIPICIDTHNEKVNYLAFSDFLAKMTQKNQLLQNMNLCAQIII